MTSNLESTDYVRSIDPLLDPQTRAKLERLVRDEASSDRDTTLHPLVSTSYTPAFSPLISTEHTRLENEAPKPADSGIDLSRYELEALEPPNKTSPHSDERNPELLEQWQDTLEKAYISSTYLSGRNTNLGLLETYGKNAWLIANWHNEGTLKSLEAELAGVKQKLEEVEGERSRVEREGAAEMGLLEDTWKKGIRGVVEVQVAREGLKGEVLEARRKGLE